MRTMNIDLGQPISYGRTAEIYPWNQGEVLKLFYDWFKLENIEKEAWIAQAVHSSGLPVPAVGEIIRAAIMPTIAGALADMFSLYAPMWMAAISGLVIMVVSVLYVETAPNKVAKMRTKPTRDDHLLKPFRGKSAA